MTIAVSRAKAYLKARMKRVRDAMKTLKLDALMLTHPPDLAYLTNFTGDDSVGIITKDDFLLVTDFRYEEQAALEAGWLKVVLRDAKMSDAIAEAVSRIKVSRIGFEANFTAFGQVDAADKAIEAKLGSGRKVELVPLEDVMVSIRMVKDDHEVDLIRQSIGVAEEAFTALRENIKPGETENYLAGLLVLEMRSRGASGSSFPPIIGAGTNSSLCHYRPGEAEVQKGQPLLIDWGAMYKGYASDITRTFMIGRVSSKLDKIYKVVLEAQLAAIQFLRPGVTTVQADRVARDVIEDAGFGKYFGHGLGHGIGRDIHEFPRVSRTSKEEELTPGMVITVEPGIYIPGEGGIRIEDDVLITHSGCEVLSTLDKSFEGCHIE